MLCCPTISETQTSRPDVFAFHITQSVTEADMDRIATYMCDQFKAHDDVSMILIFEPADGPVAEAKLDPDLGKSKLRALEKVSKFAVVGAPENGNAILDAMARIIPVEARPFRRAELDAAWQMMGANPA